MATSFSDELIDSYVKTLTHYFQDYYKRSPNEIEKLTIKEAAVVGKLQNSEEDFINIYSRIHGVHPRQARDEPLQFEKFKEFMQSNVNVTVKQFWSQKLLDLKKQKSIEQSLGTTAPFIFTPPGQGQEGITRKPQYSYCAQ